MSKQSITPLRMNPQTTASLLRKQWPVQPLLGMILGSGFQNALSDFRVALELPFGQVPGFPSVGVSGHAGKLVFGHFGKIPTVVLKGRSHFYEGHDMERVTFAVRVLAELGIRGLLLTNAAGGINRRFKPGDFMYFEDHINFMGANPLRGQAWPGLPRFVDLSRVYDEKLNQLLVRSARKTKVRLHSGIYLAVSGPSYETPAEIRAFARLGADAVGMSTVPEAIVARQCGVPVAALSCITNEAAGQGKAGLSHMDVLALGESKKDQMAKFMAAFAELYGEN